jgi:hypothetical protein
MTCRNCGIRNLASNTYCANCGARLADGRAPVRAVDASRSRRGAPAGGRLGGSVGLLEMAVGAAVGLVNAAAGSVLRPLMRGQVVHAILALVVWAIAIGAVLGLVRDLAGSALWFAGRYWFVLALVALVIVVVTVLGRRRE